jgi:NAD(P)-dependent dehydrogenase (short-subunit alcohol dehydrogenase family)
MTAENLPVTRSVAITGAGSGLGREIAIGFADKNYSVFGTARAAEEIEDVRRATRGVADLTVCDITDEDAVRGWATETSDALGAAGLDVLVSNAGSVWDGTVTQSGRPVDFTSADYFRVEDGLAAQHWDTVDYVRLYQSFGLLPDDVNDV